MHLYASAPILVRPLHTLCTHTEWGGGQYSFGKILGVRWTIQRGRYSGSIQKIFPGVKMATHANVTFRTTTTINGQEETRISDRYAELSTEQAKHLLVHEQMKYSTRAGESSEGFVVTLSSTTKAFSDDTEIETL